ncbi:MAG: translocation/assembly module TamB domain-containing protein, partial [Thermodesulfobacteriota bacterium]
AQVEANTDITSHSPVHAAGHLGGRVTLKTPDLLQWEVPKTEVAVNQTPIIQGNGHFHAATGATRGNLRLLPAAREALQSAASLPKGWPQGTAQAAFSGHLVPLDLNGTLQAKVQTPQQPQALPALLGANATLKAKWGADAQGDIRMDELRLTTPRTRLWGAGNVNTQSRRLAARLHLRSQPLGWPPGEPALTEAISGTLDAQGTWDDPALTLELRTPRLFPNAPFELRSVSAQAEIAPSNQGFAGPVDIRGDLDERPARVRTTFAWHDATLFLRALQGNWGAGTLRGNLRMRPDPKQLKGTLTAHTPLKLLQPYLEQSLQGEAHARLDVHSEPETPLNLRGSVRCEQPRWGETLRIQNLTGEFDVHKTPTAFTGSGNLRLSELQSGQWHLESARLTGHGAPNDLALNATLRGASGETPFSANGNGTMQVNAADDWRLHLAHLKGSATPKLDFRLTESAALRKQGDTWSVRLPTATLGPGSFSLNGQWAPKSVSGEGSAQGLPLAGLNPFLPHPLVGRADTEFQLSGSPQKPHLQGTLSVKNGKLRQGRWKTLPTLDGQASWDWRPGALQASLTAEQEAANASLRASATVPLTLSLAPLRLSPQPEGTCQGELDMGADLKALPRILDTDGMQSKGRLTASATVNGTWQDPQVQGTAELEQGRFEHVYQGIVLEDITAQCRANAQGIHDLQINGTDGAKGTFSLQGAIPLRPSPRAELTARLDHLALIRLDQLQSVLSGDVRLQGPFKTASLQGEATLDRTEIRLPEQMPPSVSDVDITNTHTAASQPSSKSSAAPPPVALDLDLDLTIPRRFFVRGRGLEAEFKGQCHVGGSTQEPRLQGELEAVWGRFSFFSKTLDIETGQLFFENHSPPEPRLNVAAEHSENDFLARIWLTGPVDDPGIRMESEPPLPEEEILGRVLFGRSVSSLNPLQAIQLAQALRSLSTGNTGGSLTTKFFEKTRQLLELDELGVSSGEGGPSIGMGKYLQENVYLRAQKGLENSEDKISVEIELFPHISVDSQVGGQGRSGVGLNWKLDY